MRADNYGVLSTIKITCEGEAGIIGIGAIRNVCLTRELDEALDKGLTRELTNC